MSPSKKGRIGVTQQIAVTIDPQRPVLSQRSVFICTIPCVLVQLLGGCNFETCFDHGLDKLLYSYGFRIVNYACLTFFPVHVGLSNPVHFEQRATHGSPTARSGHPFNLDENIFVRLIGRSVRKNDQEQQDRNERSDHALHCLSSFSIFSMTKSVP